MKKQIRFILGLLLLNLYFGAAAFAAIREEKEIKLAKKIKTDIAKLGTGKDAKIEVRLKDGTKLKGYVSQINETGFFVIDEKTGTAHEVPFLSARQVKGNNLSTGAKIAIFAAVIALIVVIAAVPFAP